MDESKKIHPLFFPVKTFLYFCTIKLKNIIVMRKVVLNNCFGGFQLSPIAKVAYARRKGIIPQDAKVYFYTYPTDEEYCLKENRADDDIQGGYMIKRDETFISEHRGISCNISIEDFGDKFPFSYFDPNILDFERTCFRNQGMSEKEINKAIKRNIDFYNGCKDVMHDKEFIHIDEYDIPRHDPELIVVVEELGPAVAGDFGTKLVIEEIDDDEKYIIKEFDGKETLEVSSDWQ